MLSAIYRLSFTAVFQAQLEITCKLLVLIIIELCIDIFGILNFELAHLAKSEKQRGRLIGYHRFGFYRYTHCVANQSTILPLLYLASSF